MGVLIRGFLLGNDREKVVGVKGKKGVQAFDAIVGPKEWYSPAKNYPIEKSLTYLKAAAKVIYGGESAEAFRNLGAWDFKIIVKTQVGKVAFSLFSPTLEKTLENFVRLMNAFYIGMECESKMLGDKKADLIICNDPYPDTYFLGLFEESVRYFGFVPHITAEKTANNRHIFHFAWEEKKIV